MSDHLCRHRSLELLQHENNCVRLEDVDLASQAQALVDLSEEQESIVQTLEGC